MTKRSIPMGPTPGEPGKLEPNAMQQIVEAAIERTSQDQREIEQLRRDLRKACDKVEQADLIRAENTKLLRELAEERLARIKLLQSAIEHLEND